MASLLKQTPLKKKFYDFLNVSKELIESAELRYSSTKEDPIKIAERWFH